MTKLCLQIHMHAYLYNATTPQQNKIFAYIIIHIIIIIIIMNL